MHDAQAHTHRVGAQWSSAERTALEHLASRRAARHASAVMSVVRDPLFVIDESGVITDVNEPMCALTGTPRHGLLGRRAPYPFWPRRVARANRRALEAALRSADPVAHAEWVLRVAGGAQVAVAVLLAPMRTSEGDVIGYAATLRVIQHPQATRPDAEAASLRDDDGRAVERAVERVAACVLAGASSAQVLHCVASAAAGLVSADAATIFRCGADGAEPIAEMSSAGATGSAAISPQELRQLRSGEVVDRSGADPDRDSEDAVFPLGANPVWGTLLLQGIRSLDPGRDRLITAFLAAIWLTVVTHHPDGDVASTRGQGGHASVLDSAALRERLRIEVARVVRHAGNLSLAYIQVDGLAANASSVAEADRVMALVGERLARVARDVDAIGRVRHDTFAWLLIECDARHGEQAAHRALAAMEELSDPAGLPVTLSVGVAEVSGAPDGAARRVIRDADAARAAAVRDGGNCVVRTRSAAADAAGDVNSSRRRLGQATAAIRMLARVIDEKCGSGHPCSSQVAALSERLALALGWDRSRAGDLYDAALVRDIGLIGIPDDLLHADWALDRSERLQLRNHSLVSSQIAAEVMSPAQVRWIAEHHDRFDGIDTLSGRRGDALSEGGRIIAVAERWIELCGSKGSTHGMSHRDAIQELRSEAGWQLWPAGVDALIGLVAHELPARWDVVVPASVRTTSERAPIAAGV